MRAAGAPAPLRALGIGLLGAAAFSLLSFFYADRQVAAWCRTHVADGLHRAAEFVTGFGHAEIYLLPAAAVWLYCRWRVRKTPSAAYWPRRAHAAAFVFLSVAASGLTVDVVKAIAGRYRPSLYFSRGLYGFSPFSDHWAYNSFPSGHSQTAFAAMTALAAVAPPLRVPALILATMVAASRVLLAVHYLGDVTLGTWFGFAGTVLLGEFYRGRGIELRWR